MLASVIYYYIQIVYKYVYTLNKILNVFFLIACLEIYLHDDNNSQRSLSLHTKSKLDLVYRAHAVKPSVLEQM